MFSHFWSQKPHSSHSLRSESWKHWKEAGSIVDVRFFAVTLSSLVEPLEKVTGASICYKQEHLTLTSKINRKKVKLTDTGSAVIGHLHPLGADTDAALQRALAVVVTAETCAQIARWKYYPGSMNSLHVSVKWAKLEILKTTRRLSQRHRFLSSMGNELKFTIN